MQFAMRGLFAVLILFSSTYGVQAQDNPGFAAWLDAFRVVALEAGISAEVFDSAFEGVQVSERVLAADASQPEFTRTIWSYLDGAVSSRRITQGQARLAENSDLFDQIEERFDVDRHVVVAIWGLESDYGQVKGDLSIIQALATLAYDGRRAAWGREQLLTALLILEQGNMSPEEMRGSWAGAMGHTQFIPTSYMEYGVDMDGDNRRDLIGSHADALGSTANYLARAGWDNETTWGREVVLPMDFAYALSGQHNQQSLSQWRTLGIQYTDGTPIEISDATASIIAPAGSQGPAFLIFNNFAVIKRYNNSTAYVMAIGHLADRLRGGDAFMGNWPRDGAPLNLAQRREVQSLLTSHGYNPGTIDGILGARTRAAVRSFQRQAGLIEDGYVSMGLLERLREGPVADDGTEGATP